MTIMFPIYLFTNAEKKNGNIFSQRRHESQRRVVVADMRGFKSQRRGDVTASDTQKAERPVGNIDSSLTNQTCSFSRFPRAFSLFWPSSADELMSLSSRLIKSCPLQVPRVPSSD